MPVADCFLDTNILLYAVSTEPAEADKTQIARALLETSAWGWSAQVMAEFVSASTSPRRKRAWTRADARREVVTWMKFPMIAISGELVLEALRLGERFQISHYDAQIVAAARALGCATLYSEDLNDGQDYDGVRVSNPFNQR